MKQMVCEMCGGKDLIKQDSVFVCQNCGSKYSVEEAKKMMVTIDTSAKLENALKNARRARENKNYEQAEECYKIVLMEEPDNWEANFYSIYFKAMQTNMLNISQATYSITNSIKTVFKDIKKLDDTIQQNEAIKQMSTDIFAFASMLYKATTNSYISSLDFGNNHRLFENKLKGIDDRKKILPSTEMLKLFGNEIILEFGKNEFTGSINIQCHETALKILREFYDLTTDANVDVHGFKKSLQQYADAIGFRKLLQQYADDLEKINPTSHEITRFNENKRLEKKKWSSCGIVAFIIPGMIVIAIVKAIV